MRESIIDDGMCRTCHVHCGERATRSYVYLKETEEQRLVDIHCESCIAEERRARYRASNILTSRLMMDAAMWGYHQNHEENKYDHGPLSNWHSKVCALRDAPPVGVPEAMWGAYGRQLDSALAILPDRFKSRGADAQNPPLLTRGLITASMMIVDRAEDVFSVRDAKGAIVAQPRCYKAVNASVAAVTEVFFSNPSPARRLSVASFNP